MGFFRSSLTINLESSRTIVELAWVFKALAHAGAFGGSELWFKVPARLSFDAGFNFNSGQSTNIGVTSQSLGTVTMLCCLEVQAQFHPVLDILAFSCSPIDARASGCRIYRRLNPDAKLGLTHRGRGLQGPKCCSLFNSPWLNFIQLCLGHVWTWPLCMGVTVIGVSIAPTEFEFKSEFTIISNLSFSTDVCLNLRPGVLLSVYSSTTYLDLPSMRRGLSSRAPRC
ncbi:hypothetical protein C8R46DRAFT_1231828 [Mycena filopes]|nr:hypothetical protein C8R46DRAFT_1231828 [Mycena filopes]